MIKIAVCDDSAMEAEFLQELLAGWRPGGGQAAPNVQLFASAEALLQAQNAGAGFELCFVDMILPGMDGAQLARALRQSAAPPLVVFLTASRDYHAEAAGAGAFGYLLKPPRSAVLYPLLDEAAQALRHQQSRPLFALPARGKVVQLPAGDIAAVRAAGGRAHWQLSDGRSIEGPLGAGGLKALCAPLSALPGFFWLGRRCLINLAQVQALEKNAFVLSAQAGGEVLPIPLARRGAAKAAYLRYIGRQNSRGSR